jgi:hypothetical protein
MILRLMRKDLLLHRSMVVLLAAGIVFEVVLLSFGAGTQRIDGVSLEVVVFIATACGSLLTSLFAGRDDRYRTAGFDLALPVTRRQVVFSRYLLSLLALPLWLGLTAVTRWACRWPVFPAQTFAPGTLVLALSAFVTGMGIVYPLVAAAGFSGLLYGFVGMLVLALLVVISVRLVPAVRPVVQTLGRIVPLLDGLHARLGDPWYLLAVVGGLLCLWGLSFSVAEALYERRFR